MSKKRLPNDQFLPKNRSLPPLNPFLSKKWLPCDQFLLKNGRCRRAVQAVTQHTAHGSNGADGWPARSLRLRRRGGC